MTLKFIAPREGANAPHTRSFPKLYWFFYLLVLFAAPLTDSMASDIVLTPHGSKKTIDLSSRYSNPGFIFSDASSSAPESVAVSLNDAILTLTPKIIGTSTIRVTINRPSDTDLIYVFTAEVNSLPTGALGGVTLSIASGAETVNLAASISDPYGDSLTFKATSSHTSRVTVSLNGSTLTLTPVARGTSTINVTASDGHTSTAFPFTATVDNSWPTGSLGGVTLTVAGGAQTVDLAASISDPDGDSLTFKATSSHTSHVTTSLNGSTLTLTPVARGTSTIKVTASDGHTSMDFSFTATVDNSPPTGALRGVTLSVGGGAATVDLAAGIRDPDGDSLTFEATSSHTSRVTVSLNGSTLTLTPVAIGTSTINVTASDGNASVGFSFTVTVEDPNPPSKAQLKQPLGTIPLPDVKLVVGGGAKSVDVSAYVSGADGETLNFFNPTSSQTSYVTVSLNGSTLTLTPVARGASTITVSARDNLERSITLSFTATVLRNKEITGQPPDVMLTVGGGAKSVDVSAYVSDPEGGDIIFFSPTSSQTSYVTVTLSGSTLTLTPVAAGASTISASMHDNLGQTVTVSFTATVIGVKTSNINPQDDSEPNPDVDRLRDNANNGLPQAVGTVEPIELFVGDTRQVSVRFSDPDGDTLTYNVTGNNNAVSATMSDNSLTIVAIGTGEATLAVTATDPHGAGATQTIDVTVVRPPQTQQLVEPTPQPSDNSNRAPQRVGTIAPITLSVQATKQLTVQFTDPDGDTLSYNVTGNNNAVSAGMSGSSLTIVGLTEGTATLTVTATDPHGATATQSVNVTVIQPSDVTVPKTNDVTVPKTSKVRLSASRILIKVSGDNQSAQIHNALPNPIVVEVRDEHERVVEGVTVQFEFLENGLALDSTPTTDANGQAFAKIRFGDTPGKFTVEVSVTGIDEPVVFTATATTSSRDVVYIDSLEVAPNPDDLTMNRVYGVAYSPDGKTLASAHGDRTVRMWDVETRELKRTLGGSLTATSLERRGHKSAARSVAFSPDGNILASGGRGGRMLLWDAGTGRLKQFVLRHAGAVWSLAFSPDGNTLAAATEGGYVYIYDVSNSKKVVRKHRLRAHSVRAWSVAFSPDGRFLASGGGDTVVRLWDYETGSIKKVLKGHEEQVLSVAFGADNTLASSSADGTVRMWDVETKSSRILDGHTDWVFSVAFHPNGDILASTGKDMSVRLWDTTSGVPLNTLKRHTKWGRDVAISRDGILASAGYDNLIYLWDSGVRSDDAVQNDGREGTAQQQTTVQLLPNYPNPFNPETWIPYQLETASDVSLSIYNVSGRLVRTIELGYQPAGLYANRSDAVYWNGRNNHGEQVASGMYVYRLTAGDYSASRRMVIVK